MANKQNEAYLLREELKNKDYKGMQKVFSEHGTDVKHFGLIKEFAIPSNDVKKNLGEKPLNFVGVDIETQHDTGELKLIGFYNGGYKPILRQNAQQINDEIYEQIHTAYEKGNTLAFWGELDGAIIHRTILENNGYKKADVEKSLSRVGYVQGEFHNGFWTVKPIARTIVNEYTLIGNKKVVKRRLEFGISKIVKDTYLFYFIPLDEHGKYKAKKPFTVWGYNIKDLYNGSIEENTKKLNIEYNKLGKEYHVINWERFKHDKDYRNHCLYANLNDARAVKELAYSLSNSLFDTFQAPIKTMISTGSLSKYVLSTLLDTSEYNQLGYLSLMKQWEEDGISQEVILKSSNVFVESYTAGLIESLALGYAEQAAQADLTGAYASVMRTLPNFKGCKIELVKDYPKECKPNEFYFIRAVVDVPHGVEHTLTVKTPKGRTKYYLGEEEARGTIKNARLTGIFVTTAVYEEFEYAKEQGAEILYVDEVVKITTKGEETPLKKVIDELFSLRLRLKREGKSDLAIKQAMSALYGKTFEAYRLHEEDNEGTHFVGWRAGDLFNPIIASITTAYTRLILQHTTNLLRKNGAKVLMQMTDAIWWTHSDKTDLYLQKAMGDKMDVTTGILKGMLPKDFTVDVLKRSGRPCADTGWREDKTLNYFEEPSEEFYDMLCLGVGRYEHTDKQGNITTKALGLNLVKTDFNNATINHTWKNAIMHKVKKTVHPTTNVESEVIEVEHQVLINAGYVNVYKKEFVQNKLVDTNAYLTFGAITTDKRYIEVLNVFPKRNLGLRNFPKLSSLLSNLYVTEPVNVSDFGFITGDSIDGTLPGLRQRTEELFAKTKRFTPKHDLKAKKIQARKRFSTKQEEVAHWAKEFNVSQNVIKFVTITFARECSSREELLQRAEEKKQEKGQQ